MGVPKFFRYISERYPCLSEYVKEYQIPAFDNLYLDMNGIIHMCSHPDDHNPHFRITEEKIFADIFHYIEVLFQMIKPQKVFFMAVDGVAPRAKMNQQRGRRFRSAKDAEKLEKEAVKKGETLPDGERFDSNCITPGTEFMARLHEQLKYFVVKKVSTDKLWKKCKIILSGHETPGEGEHKIMDYIRYARSKPGYDPNTRHCLYGLDADLIMLGLCTHDPHFSLLREEVKFGKKAKRTNVPEEIRFYLLHLSLMREYLELEFSPLKKKLEGSELKFDIEKIIDDWILMGFLVGNDFIPNLPNLHITNGALPVLYKAYMDVLPTLDGYINEAGTLNLDRFEKFMNKLADIDLQNFEEVYDDVLYMAAKTGRKQNFHTKVQSKPSIDDIFGTDCQEYSKDPGLEALIAATDELDVSSEEESDQMSSSNEDEAFKSYKDEYYRNKLEYQKVTPEVMREQAEGYVRAIQWNLHYYYNGVCSWSWFYPHHYSPYISDIKGFRNLKIDFELGKPFQPYEQLLAVLPTASKNLLPKCYHSLMTDERSTIKAYYPEEFQTDLNGKKQEWEAVVLVPFIDENVLLEAMKPCNELLTPEEAERNQHGPMLVYEYSEENLGTYEAPSYFLPIDSHAKCKPVSIEDIRVPQDQLVKGRYPNVVFDVFYPGFPTMKHLHYESKLKKAKVKVFEMCSRMESMILKISAKGPVSDDDDDVPLDMLGKVVWVGWPHLVEARVVALSNRKKRFTFSKTEKTRYKVEDTRLFENELEGVTQHYRERMGIDFGDTQILVHVQRMIGRKYVYTSGRRVTLQKQFSDILSSYPLQSVVTDIAVHDEYQSTFLDVCDIFSESDACFSLSHPHYGAQGTIMNSEESLKNNYLTVSLSLIVEPDLSRARDLDEKLRTSYMPLAVSARYLRMSNYVFSRLTGSLFLSVKSGESQRTANIGLDLKFNKKNQETPGYTKKIDQTWMYSRKAVDLVGGYLKEFPEVFEFLANQSGDEIRVDDIFESDGDEKVKRIQAWMKTLPTYNLERRVCGSCVLEPEVVAEIENIVDGLQESPKNISVQIKPQMLYKPGIQVGNLPPDPLATTQVFDRVVNVREDTVVPLGLKGTVIAVHKAPNALDNDSEMYDVVFDTRFPGGTAHNCSDHRGYRLPKTSLINISHGRRQMEQQTGAPGALRNLAKDRSAGNSFVAGLAGNNPRVPNSAFASFNKTPPKFVPPPPPHAARNFPYPNPVNPHPGKSVMALPDGQKVQNPLYFMPNFGQAYDPKPNKENSAQRQRNVPVNVQNQRPSSSHVNVQGRHEAGKRPSNVNPRPVQPQQRTEVDTDFLKRILNINNNSNTTRSHPPPQSEPSRPPRPFINRAPEVSNSVSAAARLLSYYQSNAWGCPRYTYLEEDNGFCAQLVLPDGKIMNGRIARTREEASDNVASEALKMFQFISKELPSQFPVPPTKWVQDWRQPNQNMVPQVFVNKSHQRPHPKPDFHNRRDLEHNTSRSAENSKPSTNVHAPNFVPLQALKKKQGNKPVSSVNRNQNNGLQLPKPEKISILKPTTQNAADASKAHGSSINEKREKNRRERKPRIAANFNV